MWRRLVDFSFCFSLQGFSDQIPKQMCVRKWKIFQKKPKVQGEISILFADGKSILNPHHTKLQIETTQLTSITY